MQDACVTFWDKRVAHRIWGFGLGGSWVWGLCSWALHVAVLTVLELLLLALGFRRAWLWV